MRCESYPHLWLLMGPDAVNYQTIQSLPPLCSSDPRVTHTHTHGSPQEGAPSFFLFPYVHFLSRHRYVHTLTQERKQFTLYSEELISFLFHSRMRWWTRMTTCHNSAIATTPPHYLSPHRGTLDIVAESEVTVLLTTTPNMPVGWGQVLSFQLCPHSLSLRACMRVCGGGGWGGMPCSPLSEGLLHFSTFSLCVLGNVDSKWLLRRTMWSPGHALMKALWCWQTLSPRGGISFDCNAPLLLKKKLRATLWTLYCLIMSRLMSFPVKMVKTKIQFWFTEHCTKNLKFGQENHWYLIAGAIFSNRHPTKDAVLFEMSNSHHTTAK